MDTNIWIDHLRIADLTLAGLSTRRLVGIHPYTIAEIALGSFANCQLVLDELSALPTPGGKLWTSDKRLYAQAEQLGVAYQP